MAVEVLTHTRVSRAQIDRLTDSLRKDEVQLETWHHFADGLVARTIKIPKGTPLTGAPHKREHLNICSGDITVTTDQGVERITGYRVLPCLPSEGRAGFAHADTWWTTVHANPTNEHDIAKLEDAFVERPGELQSRRNLLER